MLLKINDDLVNEARYHNPHIGDGTFSATEGPNFKHYLHKLQAANVILGYGKIVAVHVWCRSWRLVMHAISTHVDKGTRRHCNFFQ
jgi:hypothetical protein